MTCRDVREIADSYLSGELLVETNHDVLRHLAGCPECRADLAARSALRESVRRAFENANALSPRPEFVVDLRTRLRNAALDTPSHRPRVSRGWWALAATLLLAVTFATLMVRHRPVTSRDLAQLAVGDHLNCALHFRLAEKPIPLQEAARRYDAGYRVLQAFPPDDLTTTSGTAHVLERHSCVYGGRRFAHIVLRYRGELVSLLVTRSDQSAPTALPKDALAEVTSDGRFDDVSVVSFRTPRYAVFFAGAVDHADLVQLADVVAGPLHRQLSGV
jgi:anti-sigma factor RsiW